jgi:hypothetical protein
MSESPDSDSDSDDGDNDGAGCCTVLCRSWDIVINVLDLMYVNRFQKEGPANPLYVLVTPRSPTTQLIGKGP